MRRILFLLLAFCAMAMTFTTEASAKPSIYAGCTLVSTASTAWPYNSAYYCGGINPTKDQSNLNTFLDTLLQFQNGWLGTQNATYGGNFYIFPTTATANTALKSQKQTQLTGKENGVTFLTDNPSKTTGTTLVIETPSIAFALPINNVTAHEMGHYADKFGASAGGGTGSQTLSDTDIYSSDQLGIYDIPAFDAYLNCTTTNQGVFDGVTWRIILQSLANCFAVNQDLPRSRLWRATSTNSGVIIDRQFNF